MKAGAGAESLPYEKLMECTHCGLCLPYCPTYRELGVEMDSPRGRIYLVRALEDRRVALTEKLALHLDLCVGCRACETACPSDVAFGSILEHGRHLLGERPGTMPRLLNFLYRQVLPKKDRILALGKLLGIVQHSPLKILMDFAIRDGLLPEEMANALDILTTLPVAPQEELRPVYEATSEKRLTAGLLICCMMRVLLTEVNTSTIRALNRSGCEVVVPSGQECCGALHAHAGQLDEARRLAMINIRAFERSEVEVIVTNSAGCGAHMRDYPQLFRGLEEWEDRARGFSEKVRDVSEVLDTLGPSEGIGPLSWKVAYDDPCHLLHGQGVGEEPRRVLRRIPNLGLVDLKEAEWCCGSAGSYMFTQREMALRLLRRKLEDIESSGADIVATGNPGCLLWLAWGLKRWGIPASCLHPVQVLDAAYG